MEERNIYKAYAAAMIPSNIVCYGIIFGSGWIFHRSHPYVWATVGSLLGYIPAFWIQLKHGENHDMSSLSLTDYLHLAILAIVLTAIFDLATCALNPNHGSWCWYYFGYGLAGLITLASNRLLIRRFKKKIPALPL